MDEKRFELWLRLGQFLIGTVVLGLATAVVNWQIQTRQVEIQEIEQLGKFVEHAIDENLTVRQRFADYFATVSQSETFRERWEMYKSKIDKELEKIEAKAKELEKKKEVEIAEKAELLKQLQNTQEQVQDLEASWQNRVSLNEEERKKLQIKMEEQEATIRKAQAAALERDQKLALLQSTIQAAESELTYTRRNDRVQVPTSKQGWVYLGEFDISSKKWINRYWNIGINVYPESLVGQNIQVTATAINVRNDSNPWSQEIGNLKRNAIVFVEKIERWGLTGYYWAKVTYGT